MKTKFYDIWTMTSISPVFFTAVDVSRYFPAFNLLFDALKSTMKTYSVTENIVLPVRTQIHVPNTSTRLRCFISLHSSITINMNKTLKGTSWFFPTKGGNGHTVYHYFQITMFFVYFLDSNTKFQVIQNFNIYGCNRQ